MTVKQWISKLNQFEENSEVIIANKEGDNFKLLAMYKDKTNEGIEIVIGIGL